MTSQSQPLKPRPPPLSQPRSHRRQIGIPISNSYRVRQGLWPS